MKNFNLILKELFYALSASLIIFSFFEIIKPKSVLAYFNINWVLILWIVNAILLLVLNKEEKSS